MDPLAAFQVGASLVNFVEFSLRLVTESASAYKSPDGESPYVIELSALSSDLKEMQVRIEQVVAQYPLDPNEKSLLERCGRCDKIGKELQATIDRLTRQGTSRWQCAQNSFVVTAKGLWDTDKVAKLRDELHSIRSLVMMDILVSLWSESKGNAQFQAEASHKLDRISDRLDKSSKALLSEIRLLRSQSPEKKVKPNVNDSDDAQAARNKRTGFVEQIWSSDWRLKPEDVNASASNRDLDLEKVIIESLCFKNMHDRSTQIADAHKLTYQWIFHDEDDQRNSNEQRLTFPSWLESQDNSIYWITGKAGSGKSTLMKFILNHSRLKQHLEHWAKDLKPLWLGYYFWEAGSNPLQKSQLGMLRTLLHGCLQQRPDLVHAVCPRRWLLYSVMGNSLFDPPQWDWKELSRSLESLAKNNGKDFRLAFFLDGLDEFNGNPDELIDFIYKLLVNYKVKICVASRPWNEFRDAFSQCPSLEMQTLTQHDMEIFVRDHFDNFLPFEERRAASFEASEQIVDTILSKAHGVFLWVTLVVRTLRSSMAEGKTMAELHQILSKLPEDMMSLYTKIWLSVSPSHLEKSSRLFQLKAATKDIFPLDAKFLWALDKEIMPTGDSSKILKIITPILARRLDTCTRGVLELSPSGHIEYLHRTASEWIQQPSTWRDIRSKTPPEFDASLSLLDTIIDIFSGDLDYFEEKGIFPSISRALLLASNVSDRSETNPHLICSLDRLNFVISGSHESSCYKLTPWLKNFREHEVIHPALGGAMRYRKLQSFINLFRSRKENDSCNSFIGLTAQFGILPYVREKLERNPQLVRKDYLVHKSSRTLPISLIENAIWGILAPCLGTPDRKHIILRGGDHIEFWVSEHHQLPEAHQRHRFKLIELLLKANDAPNQSAHLLAGNGTVREQLTLTIEALREGKSLCSHSKLACISIKPPCNMTQLYCDELARSRLEQYFQSVLHMIK